MNYLIPLLLFALLAPFTPLLDMEIATYFHQHAGPSALYQFVFTYGIYPANIIGIGGLVVFLLSYVIRRLKPYRWRGLYFALVLGIGAGLIINLGFKEFWGRPRPRQVVEFGGTQEYRPFWKPNFHPPEPSKGFPCGHCSMAFYFFALPSRRYRMIVGLLFGALMSWVRMAQEGHFLSDVLAAAVIMWLVAAILYPLLARDRSLPAS